ncbi:PepSY domain-containing protein [Enterovirga rhinocerotis]|uniref:Peptidase YpeB-like protein n=1 Tax=Enterovirga rhinocerotis TaxID=1339210 RepID=A0A4R7BU00_9HYPH|nr:PepSY domain-containing protein [Enterovirga rhinocerotis]TDR88971.1 peptidase YpeB-like protein [Enterovirga rhinocerotis]
MWRALGIVLILLGGAEPSGAADPPEELAACLSSGDAEEAVASRRVIRPAAAIGAARDAVPNGDVLRASLCRDGGALVYRITTLRGDGRLARVTVDAPSGKVRSIH